LTAVFRLQEKIVVWAGGDNADPAQLGNNDFSLHYVKLKQPVSRQAVACHAVEEGRLPAASGMLWPG
jgi:hypothetical protein